MKIRLRLRTLLLAITVLPLVGWDAAKVTTWYLHRSEYRDLAAFHRDQAHRSISRQNRMKKEHRRATYRLVELYKKFNRDYQEVASDPVRRKKLGDPRRGWTDAMRAHQEEIDRLAMEAARHKWLAKWYERAYTTPWCEPPVEEIRAVELEGEKEVTVELEGEDKGKGEGEGDREVPVPELFPPEIDGGTDDGS